MTACKDCKHSTPERACQASPMIVFDYWNGKPTMDRFQYKWCWEVNTDGKCPRFEVRDAKAGVASAPTGDPALQGR